MQFIRPRIIQRYPAEITFDDVEPLEDREGEPLTMTGKGILEEDVMEENDPGPSNWKGR